MNPTDQSIDEPTQPLPPARAQEKLGDRRPTPEDITELELTRLCIAESLRMYPEPPLLIRRAIEEDEIPRSAPGKQGETVKMLRGSDIFIAVYNLVSQSVTPTSLLRLFGYPNIFCLDSFTQLTHSLVYSLPHSISSMFQLSVRSFVHLFVRSFVRFFVFSFVRCFVRLFGLLFGRSAAPVAQVLGQAGPVRPHAMAAALQQSRDGPRVEGLQPRPLARPALPHRKQLRLRLPPLRRWPAQVVSQSVSQSVRE